MLNEHIIYLESQYIIHKYYNIKIYNLQTMFIPTIDQ